MKTIIRNEADRRRAVEIIARLPLEKPQEVDVREHKKNRSAAQNSLLWKWLTVIAAELGESKEDVHERCKERFLVPILRRDDPDFAAMIGSVNAVHASGMKAEAIALKREIVRLTSTTQMSVQQFTEYLNDIELDARNMGIILPHPEDLYTDALGRR
jgi:hypothetical protein